MENLNLKDSQISTSIKREHKLIIGGRKTISIFGVVEVLGTTSDFLSVKLSAEILNIKGKNISIKNLVLIDGVLEANGCANEIKYQASFEKKNLFKRIFK